MLSIGMKPGDYVTVGDHIVVQYTGTEGKLGTVLFEAPREVSIVRGQVREREGIAPPTCLRKGPFKHPGSIKWGQ